MKKEQESEYKRDIEEVFGQGKCIVVSLPQFVIDRVQPCIDASEDGLTLTGELMWISGVDEDGHRLEDKEDWWATRPSGMPRLTKKFESWRDETLFSSLRQMKIMLALIYRYQLEENPNQTEIDI